MLCFVFFIGQASPHTLEKSRTRSWSSVSSGRAITYSSVSTISEDDGRNKNQRRRMAAARKAQKHRWSTAVIYDPL